MILSGQSYKPLGAPPALARTDMSTMTRELSTSQVRLPLANKLECDFSAG